MTSSLGFEKEVEQALLILNDIGVDGRLLIVETQVTNAVVFLSNTEVQADCLDVTDMQVAVRLRRETRLNTSVVHSVC